MNIYDSNYRPFISFCEGMVNHKRYALDFMDKDAIYRILTKVGKEFGSDKEMLDVFIMDLDFFSSDSVQKYEEAFGEKLAMYNYYIGGTVYTSLFFIMYCIMHFEPGTVCNLSSTYQCLLANAYNCNDGKSDSVEILDKAILEIQKFKCIISSDDGKLFYGEPGILSELVSSIINCMPVLIPELVDANRSADVLFRFYGRTCRARRKKHDAAECIKTAKEYNCKILFQPVQTSRGLKEPIIITGDGG